MYTTKNATLRSIVEGLNQDRYAIPAFQRPIVWNEQKMVDLIDSVYRGMPIGTLYTWECAGIPIKDGSESTYGMELVIDGQQRLSALKTVLLGKPILTKKYEEKIVRVAFNPVEGIFKRATRALTNNSRWFNDIALIYANPTGASTPYRTRNTLSPYESKRFVENMNRFYEMQSLPIIIHAISPAATLDEVYECFHRTNAKQTKVNSGDLCLTWIETYDSNVAETIALFCQNVQPNLPTLFNARRPSQQFQTTEFANAVQWTTRNKGTVPLIYHPSTHDIANVLFSLSLQETNLGAVSGKLEGLSPEDIKEVHRALLEVVSETNFTRFNNILIPLDGMSTANRRNYAYWMFLHCRRCGYRDTQIARLLQRWYLLTLLDDNLLGGGIAFTNIVKQVLSAGSPEAYLRKLEDLLPEKLWSELLPEQLRTGGNQSSAWHAWKAVQGICRDTALFADEMCIGQTGYRALMDEHHIYPKKMLKASGVPTKQINAIANLALTTQQVNRSIGDKAPETYIAGYRRTLHNADTHLQAHCIPHDVGQMSYEMFLKERSNLMARKIKKGYENLTS